MKNSFYILKRDLMRILKNKVAVLVMIGVCIIPSLYAWFNIAANMDPYSNTNKIKVAVVNNDQKALYKDISCNAGNDIIDNLKKNDKLDWQFVGKKKAIEGVKSGKYYAAIIIKENFSKSLLSITSGTAASPELSYYVNEKKNAIAPKITSTGASTIQAQINETFSSVAAKSISELIKANALSLYNDVNTSKKSLNNSLESVSKNFKEYEENIEALKDSVTATQAEIDAINKSIDKVNLLLSSSITTLDSADRIVKSTKNASNSLVTEVFSASSENIIYLNSIYQTTSTRLNSEAERLSTINSNISAQLSFLNEIVSNNEDVLSILKDANQTNGILFESVTSKLEAQNQKLSSIIDILSEKNALVETKITNIKTADKNLGKLIDTCNLKLAGNGQLASDKVNNNFVEGADKILSLTGQARGSFTALPGTLNITKDVLTKTKSALDDTILALENASSLVQNITSEIDLMRGDLSIIENSKAFKKLLSFQNLDASSVGSFIESPVKIDTKALFPVRNYGSAMAPFYTNLALWVGGIVLVSIIKLEVDLDEKTKKATASQTYLGRLFLLILLAAIQGIIVTIGDVYILDAQCTSPKLFILSGVICSIIFTNIIFSLAITFKHIGKALCVLFIILQIPGGAGTYPIEMTPMFFRRIHPFLPFTYGISAMREATAGLYSDVYFSDLFTLSFFIPVSLFVGLLLRPLLININNMFDNKLKETDLMISEKNTLTRKVPHLDLLVISLTKDKAFSEEFNKRKQNFNYKAKIKRGLIFMAILPLVFLFLMFFIKAKMTCLILWIISMIIAAVYLIVIEYINYKFKIESNLNDLSRDEIIEKIREEK